MSQLLRSTRLGDVEVADEAVLDFPRGLIGLGGQRYALVPHAPDSPFWWLQSVEDPDLALPVTSPWTFFPEYELALGDDDAAAVGEGAAGADVYVTVRVGEEGGFAANLAAPIVVAGGTAHQVLNQAPGDLRAPLLAAA